MKKNTSGLLFQVLRISIALCFIGHGAFGIITKPIWCNYFAVFGISGAGAYAMMPWVGGMDILLGISMLVYPTRAVAAWLVFWGLVTACLRPLSGEPFAELIERAGNYGAPAVFIMLCGWPASFKGWFSRALAENKGLSQFKGVKTMLVIVCFLLLAGHAWLNLIGKKGLLDQYASLGLQDPSDISVFAGIFELAGACMLLIKPYRALLLILLVWKMASETLYPHYMAWEWVERGGSYGCLLALWLITGSRAAAGEAAEEKATASSLVA